MPNPPLIFDAHLDLAMNALHYSRDITLGLDALNAAESYQTDDPCRGRATVTLDTMRRAGVGVCLATVITRCGPDAPVAPETGYQRRDLDYASPAQAEAAALGQVAYYQRLEADGQIHLLRTRGEFDAHVARWAQPSDEALPIGVILLMEGVDSIVSSGDATGWFDRGLRAAGLAHFGRARACGGTGTFDPLTDFGRSILAEFESLGIVVDATHLSDEAMSEVFDRFDGRIMASHSNCRALAAGQRQLTDDQIRSITSRGGVIGSVLYAGMIDADFVYGEGTEAVTIDKLIDHVDHVCQLAGSAAHVGIGSDLDGGFGTEATPHGIDTIADLAKIGEAMARRGYTDDEVRGFMSDNWLRFWRDALPV